MNSGTGEGRLLPIEPYTEVPTGDAPPMFEEPAADVDEVLPPPMLKLYRCEVMPLELLPLKMLLVSTPLIWKVLDVARWPLAQMGWLPRPLLESRPLSSSAFTPGASTAGWVKLPVASGISAICPASRV